MGIEERRKWWKLWVWVVIIFAALLGYFNAPNTLTQKIIGLIVLGPLIGIVTSYVVASHVEELTGDLLKEEYFYIRDIDGYEFSISVFALVTLILEILIFW